MSGGHNHSLSRHEPRGGDGRARARSSEALAREDVAFEEIDEGLGTVRFATIALARYDDRPRRIHPLPSPTSAGRSASGAGSARDKDNKC